MNREQWSAAIQSEVGFWTRWLESGGLSWQEEFKYRADPHAEIRGLARTWLEGFAGAPKVLDVGAGPVTVLGKFLDGRAIDLTAVDALAEIYDRLPFPPGLPVLRTQQCESERLREKFDAGTFDLTYAQNTLDHSYDPAAAILQMIEVTKTGGFIATAHAANEALNENWQGFHQWNFYVEGRDLKIASRTQTFSVAELIMGRAEVVELSPDGEAWVNCVMRRI